MLKDIAYHVVFTALHCTVLYCTVLYYTILYYIIQRCTAPSKLDDTSVILYVLNS
jgi:hypothetical protein